MVVYNFGIHLFNVVLNLASFFNPKAKLFVGGRKNWEENLKQQIKEKNISKPIWIHCASLGEFEQGRPVIEYIKQHFPQQQIVLTFFSPSGYEIQKSYRFADLVCYLPLDTKYNSSHFISIVNPSMAIFVKYEFWLNYLFELHRLNIPCFLISTVIKKHQSFFKWYGANFRKALSTYKIIFAQDNESLYLLQQLNITTGKLAGDTRFDRVLQICSSPKQLPEIKAFCSDSMTIIAGSSWHQDEEILVPAFVALKKQHKNLKLIIAPHEIDKNNIERIKNLLYKNQISFHLFSDNTPYNEHSVLIINNIGLLSSIYQYGQIAMIGGGFNDGIHNILEAMVYGLPVLIGPNYQKFNEAVESIKLNAAFEVQTSQDVKSQLSKLMSNPVILQNASESAKNYVTNKSGATLVIIDDLKAFIKKD